MDSIFFLASLTVLAIPVGVVVLFVQVSGLKSRLQLVEAKLARALSNPDAPDAAPAAAPVPPAKAPLAKAAAKAEKTAPPPVKTTAPAPLPPADQNRPLVIRPDRFAALARWLQDNWVYAISAASLALAGIFFVQYGMERGLLPPAARVIAALIFGAGLIGAGEYLRRKHGDEGKANTAQLPSVFSGAGIVTIFAATVAARQLYGLIGPETAFAAHVATALLAVVLGWFSGPLLVAVGLLGAAAAPFIVSGGSDAQPWLYGYFALLTAMGLAIDAIRRWAWVSVLALVLGYGGAFLTAFADAGISAGALSLVVLALLAITLPEMSLIPRHAGPATLPALLAGRNTPRLWPPFPVRLAFGATVATTAFLFFAPIANSQSAMVGMACLAALALAILLWADRAEGLADLALIPALGFVGYLAFQGFADLPLKWDFAQDALAARAPEVGPSMTATILLVMAALISAASAYRALRPGPLALPFGFGAVLVAPVSAAVLELLWQPGLVLGPYLWALHIIAVAAGMTLLALRFARSDAPNLARCAHATLSALSLIALALFLLTTQTALTLALAVLVVISAALDRRFHLPEMSLFLQIGAAVLGYRLLADPGIGWALEAPLLQTLLAFGGSIAAMLAALRLLAPLARPTAKAVAESAALGLTAVLANVLITRWLDLGSYQIESHWGLTLNAMPWLILMLMQIYRAQTSGTLRSLRLAIAGLAGLIAASGMLMALTFGNPLFGYGPEDAASLVRGPMLLDSLLIAYGLPGLILLVAALKMPGLARTARLGFAAIGAGLGALYTVLEIRRFWRGDWLGAPGVSQPELYTYTVALMLLGAGLLYQAIAKRSTTLRRLAMAVIALTVAKVFLIDASGLTGLTRVVSFAGLGLSLAGLAWLNRWAGQVAEEPK